MEYNRGNNEQLGIQKISDKSSESCKRELLRDILNYIKNLHSGGFLYS